MIKGMTKEEVKKYQEEVDYRRIGRNIYKTGNRYRVRVGKNSCYTATRKEAREKREEFINVKS